MYLFPTLVAPLYRVLRSIFFNGLQFSPQGFGDGEWRGLMGRIARDLCASIYIYKYILLAVLEVF